MICECVREAHSLETKMTSPILFWSAGGYDGYLSNWSPHPVTENGITFKTLEHYLMYHKALVMGDMESAHFILLAESPQSAKKLGRKVKDYSEEKWHAARENVILNGLWLKSNQHPFIKEKLLRTKGRQIGEASPFDDIWGIGMIASAPQARDPKSWKGQNLLGKAWMKVRETHLLCEQA